MDCHMAVACTPAITCLASLGDIFDFTLAKKATIASYSWRVNVCEERGRAAILGALFFGAAAAAKTRRFLL